MPTMSKQLSPLADKRIVVHDLTFELFIAQEQLTNRVKQLGEIVSTKYRGKNPLFLGILNGSFIFMADLIRSCSMDCEVAFLRLSSYEGTHSSGSVSTLIGIDISITGRHLIIVEDIIDTGLTLSYLLAELEKSNPSSICIITLLIKPDCLRYELPVKHVGFEIPPEFVIGYGLDYNGLGRNLPAIYKPVDFSEYEGR